MLLDIKPSHEPSSNCIEDIFATLVKWKNKDCALIFSNAWSFHYKRLNAEHELLSARIDIYREGFKQLECSVASHYGIKASWENTDDYKKIIRIAETEISKGNPIGIYIDTFWCPWNIAYQKHHIPHYCLVVEVKDTEFVCVDSYISAKRELLSFKDFSYGYGTFFTLSFEQVLRGPDWKSIMINAAAEAIKSDNRVNDFDNMRACANEIKIYKNMKDEFSEYDDITYAPIIRRLNYISYGRKNFAKVLLYFYKKNNITELKNFAEELNGAGLKWSLINNLLFKYYFEGFGEDKLENLYMRINQIADYEENVAKNLLHFAEKYTGAV